MMSLILEPLKKKYIQNILLLLFFAFILLSRNLTIIFDGRFWAEEGSIFYANAYNMSPLHALFFVYGGYLNLPVNAATLIARWFFPLEYAPFATSFIGLFFQLLPLFLLLMAKDEWLQSFKVRLFAILLLTFVPETEEISLQSLHIQFQLVLACAIIVTLSTDNTYQRWIKLGLLILTPLSGLMSFFLLPLYAIRFYFNKSYLRLEQFFILLIGNIIQLSCFYTQFSQRSYHFSIADFLSLFFVRDLYMPFLGKSLPHSHYLLHTELTAQPHHLPFISCAISLAFFSYILFCLYKYPQTRMAGYFITYTIINLGLAVFGGLEQDYHLYELYVSQRYLFISQALFSLTLLYFSYSLPKKGQYICNILMICLLIGSIHNYYAYPLDANHILPWKQQVELWKQNPNYTFQIWPKGWTMPLSPLKH